MDAFGAPPPRRAGLAPFTEALAHVGRAAKAVSDARRWSRERRAALAVFHDEFGLRPGAGIQEVLDAVAERRGRRIESVPLSSLRPEVSGIAVLGDDVDYIGISDRLSLRHRAHVLLHEVRHLCASRPGETAATDSAVTVHHHFDGVTMQALREQMEALPAGVREEILNRPAKLRAGYGDNEEITCEVFARVVLPLLDLDATSKRTGSLNAAFANRRSI
jgi:hypothetical protein